jgi:hypothetical protein
VGEQLVQESNWDPAVLQHAEPQLSEDEWRRYEAMGEITADEVSNPHKAPAALHRRRRNETWTTDLPFVGHSMLCPTMFEGNGDVRG